MGIVSRYVFEDDLAKGQKAEQTFASWLTSKNVKPVVISTGLEKRWDITTPEDSYEVKRDYIFERTGNICVETYSCVKRLGDRIVSASKGWFYHTQADWLVVFYTDTDFYCMPMGDVWVAYFSNPKDWVKKEITQDAGYTTINWVTRLSKDMFPRVRFGSVNK